MSDVQKQAYGDADAVRSCGLPRDNPNHRAKQRQILDAVTSPLTASALEVGCGDGLHADRYERFFEDFAAVDLSPSLVARTAARLDDAPALQADATALPFADGAFDVVVGTAILHHLPDAEAALQEWARVAAREIVVMEPNYLFPLAFATTHLLPEERHKRQMAPWRVRQMAAAITDDYTVEPRQYTPPWPKALTPWYRVVDRTARRVPGLRWGGQMLLIRLQL